MIKKFCRNSNPVEVVHRKLGSYNFFIQQVIRRILNKFDREYSLLSYKSHIRKIITGNDQNIEAMVASAIAIQKMLINQIENLKRGNPECCTLY